MGIPEWVQYTELLYGHNTTTGNTDTFNRACKEIWDVFTAEHQKNGVHAASLSSGLWVMETGTYTGNGADDRNISLSNAALDIKYIRIWSEADENSVLRNESIAGDNAKVSLIGGTFSSDHIQSQGTGTFQVGTSLRVNQNLSDYYYVAYGPEV